jgi:4-amino-4-deoxy-L-arabinose transferase-like glycosyltransferase
MRILSFLCVLALCGALFFYGLNASELYQTEGLRAILAAGFLHSGNWIVPKLYGEPLLTKPPGMYAAIALASWPFGQVSAATARFPSALAASVTVWLFYGVFARRLGWCAGLIAAVILPASVFWLGRVPSAEIDLVQLAWVAAALFCFLRVLEIAEEEGRERGTVFSCPSLLVLRPFSLWPEWPWWQLALLCVAGGLLTKWTAPAFFYLTVVPLLWRRGQLRILLRPAHIFSVFIAALPCLAWAAAVAAQVGWTPLFDAIRSEALPRLSPAHHSRPYPWHELATFPICYLGANLPWSAAALWTLSPRFAQLWDEDGRRLLQLLHYWTWPNLLFWSIVPGHHLRHALPLQPGLAGLAALVWIAWLDGRLRWPVPALRPTPVFVALIALWLAIKIAFVTLIMPARDGLRAPSLKGQQIAALVPPEQTLYLFRLKDEGILFYYGRPARRLPAPDFLPTSEHSAYCLLTEKEYLQMDKMRFLQVLLWLNDEQQHPIVLVKISHGPEASAKTKTLSLTFPAGVSCVRSGNAAGCQTAGRAVQLSRRVAECGRRQAGPVFCAGPARDSRRLRDRVASAGSKSRPRRRDHRP